MLAVVFDENECDLFVNKQYPVFYIETDGKSFEQMILEAEKVIKDNKNTTIIIKAGKNLEDLNVFILALATRTYKSQKLDTAVFKVDNFNEANKTHREYAPLMIGINYIFRLAKLNEKELYKDIENLGYLGFGISNDYNEDKLILRLEGTKGLHKFEASSRKDLFVFVGLVKALSLTKNKPNVEVVINKKGCECSEKLDMDDIVREIVNKAAKFMKIKL